MVAEKARCREAYSGKSATFLGNNLTVSRLTMRIVNIAARGHHNDEKARHLGNVGSIETSHMDREIALAINRIVSELRRNSGYLARHEIKELLKNISLDAKRLEPFGFKVYSQNDEDGIIQEIFNRLGIRQGQFCEIGVENGLECNSLYLIHKGWRGWWIDGNPKQREHIEKKFGSLLAGGRLQLLVDIVTAENINPHFVKCKLDQGDLDFLSIDVDGNDIYLLEAMNSNPKVICIEYNAKFPPPITKKQVYNPDHRWTGTDYMGASLVAIDEIARKKNYTLVATNITGSNAFFVRNDLVKDLFCSNNHTEYLYNPPRYWLTFDAFQFIGHRADFGPYTDLV